MFGSLSHCLSLSLSLSLFSNWTIAGTRDPASGAIPRPAGPPWLTAVCACVFFLASLSLSPLRPSSGSNFWTPLASAVRWLSAIEMSRSATGDESLDLSRRLGDPRCSKARSFYYIFWVNNGCLLFVEWDRTDRPWTTCKKTSEHLVLCARVRLGKKRKQVRKRRW